MGYDIYIGQAVIDEECVDEDSPRLTVRVIGVELPDAPAFPNDPLSEHRNSRSPSYTGWSNFLQAAGLSELFMNNDNGLMCEHPGCCKLFESHYTRIHGALEAWRQRHSDAVPRFSSVEWGGFIMRRDGHGAVAVEPSDEATEEDSILARLIWLDWWVRWALDNCTLPAIYNF